MKRFVNSITGFLFLTVSFPGHAQLNAPGGLPQGFQHALLDAVAGGSSFYGRIKIQVSNGPDKPATSASANIAVTFGEMRLEMDSSPPGANLSPTEAMQAQQMHVINILRPDKNRSYMVFPGVKSYVEIAYAKSTGTDPTPPPKIVKTLAGSEPVGDIPCAKSQLDVTESSGEHYNMTVWTATNSGNFPIQIQWGSPPAIVQFVDLHMEAPAPGLFEPPAGYTKYEGIQDLIQRDTQKTQNAPAQ